MKITAQTDKTSVPADGTSTSTTVLTVVDEYGNPVPNATIALSSNGQANVPSTVVTDANGQATFTLTDSTAETVQVTATTENGVNCGVTVTFETVAPPITSEDVVVWNTVVDLPIQVTGATWDGNRSSPTAMDNLRSPSIRVPGQRSRFQWPITNRRSHHSAL